MRPAEPVWLGVQEVPIRVCSSAANLLGYPQLPGQASILSVTLPGGRGARAPFRQANLDNNNY